MAREHHRGAPSRPGDRRYVLRLRHAGPGGTKEKGKFTREELAPLAKVNVESLKEYDYTRPANTQKCIHPGGKHNDLDDVGRSRRHHTFFERLGNWSFGDYFKAGTIEMAWGLLTKVWKLDPTRLHVTCYEGDEKIGSPRHRGRRFVEANRRHARNRIHYFGSDNFWLMGDTGPCGPCTQIFIDRTPDKSGSSKINGDDPLVMEIWNLVFIRFNRDAAGKLTPLPAKHVDTGMGFERICQVLQNKQDNYAIDLWTPYFDRISEISSLRYTGKFPPTNAPAPQLEAADEQLRHDIAFRVVADHARCLTFALTDGAVPSNEGRGYVLRRILRRAVRFGRQQLGLTEPFLHQLVPVVVDSTGAAFPELKGNPNHRALWRLSIPCDVPDQGRELGRYRLVAAPWLYMIKPGTAERLERFVAAGGTLVLTFFSGMVDQSDLCFEGGFPGPLRKLAGVWTEELDPLWEGQSNRALPAAGQDLGLSGEYRIDGFCELVHPEGSEALAVYGDDWYAGRPVLTRHDYGKGRVYYLAAKVDQRFTDDLMGALAKELGLASAWPERLPPGVNAQVRGDGETDYVFLMNFNEKEAAGLPPFGCRIERKPARP